MAFGDQVDQVCGRVFSRLRSLWPLSHLFPLKTRLLLVKLLVIPAFTYGECVYSTNLSAAHERSLERAFSACVRFAYRLGRYDSTRRYAHKLLGAPILTYLKQRRCSALHSLVRNKEPSYLVNKLVRGSSSRSGVFVIPRHCTGQYNDSFFVSTIRDYNSVPLAIRKLNSATRFSRACLDCFTARLPSWSWVHASRCVWSVLVLDLSCSVRSLRLFWLYALSPCNDPVYLSPCHHLSITF